MIRLQCSNCDAALKVKPDAAGRRIYCPRCRHVNAVPGPDAAATASIAMPSPDAVTLPPESAADPDATLPPAAQESATLPPDGAARPPLAAGGSPAGYEILAELGRGGMGVVYKARQTRLQRTVALKMILGGGHASGADLDRFRTEAESIARLQHPNIVQIYEVGEWRAEGDNVSLPFFSLEYCGGGSLEKKLAGTPLPPREAAGLVEKLADAMQAAHDQGVIHRDLKPANILLQVADARGKTEDSAATLSSKSAVSHSQAEVPKITDFGLAKKLGEAGQTQSGSIMGTPSYMAPEQAGGRSKEIGPACDIYALGAILYECLTGRPPFRAATPLDTVLQVVGVEPVPPSQLNAKVPSDLETICLKCLQKDRVKRYATAAALAEDLARFQAGEPIAARPVSRLERTIKWAWRRPAVAALLVVSFVGAATVFAAMALSYIMVASALGDKTLALSNLENEERKTREALQREIDAAYVQRLARAHAEWKANDVGSARRLLADCPLERRGWEWNYLARLCHAERWALTCQSGPAVAVAFAEEGRQVFAVEGVGQPLKMMDKGYVNPFPEARLLRSWDLVASPPVERAVVDPGLAVVTCAAFTPDGRRVVVVGGPIPRSNQIKVLDSVTGACLRTFEKHKFPVTALAISHDGKWIASAAFLEDVLVWNVGTGAVVHTLDRSHMPISGLAFSPDGNRLAVAGVGAGLRVWGIRPAEQASELVVLKEDGGASLAVAFSADGKRLVTGGEDRSVRLLNSETGKLEIICSGHTTAVTAVKFSPDGRWIGSATGSALIGGGSAELKLWDAATGKEHLALRGHTAGINGIAFSPDGRLLASAGEDSAVRVWDMTKNQEVHAVGTGLTDVVDLAASADGRRFAVVCTGIRQTLRRSNDMAGGFKLWDATTGKQLGPFNGTKQRVIGSIAFSPSGEHFATLGMATNFKYSLQIWDAHAAKVIHTISGDFGFAEAAFSPDGKRLTALVDKRTLVWDVKTGQVTAELATGAGSLMPGLFSPDGKLLAVTTTASTKVWDSVTGKLALDCGPVGVGAIASFSATGKYFALCHENKIQLWDAATAKPLRTVAGHLLGFTPDAQGLVLVDKDGTILITDVVDGKEHARLRGNTAFPMKVAFRPDGKTAAAWNLDHTLRMWDLATGKIIRDFAPTKDTETVHFSADLRQFTTCPQTLTDNQPGKVVVRSLTTGQEVSAFQIDGDRDSSFTSVKASADGRWFAALSRPQMADNANAGSVAVWDAERGLVGSTFPALSLQPALAFRPDGQRLAVAVSQMTKEFKTENTVQFWDVAANKKLHTLPGQPVALRALAFSPDGRGLATADTKGTIKLWAADSGQEEASWPIHGVPVTRLKFSPDGKRLASLGEDGTIKIWDLGSAREVCSIPQASADLAFSPDGQRVAAASGSNLAKVWDANTGALILTLVGHGTAVQRIAFSPDGKRIVTGGADKTVRFWDAASGLELFTLRGHNEAVIGVAFDGDGSHLITADENGTVLIWDASPPASTGKRPG